MDIIQQNIVLLQDRLASLLMAPTSRIYLPFLIAGLLITLVVMMREPAKSLKPHQKLISKVVWTSRSAINDYGLIMLNALISGLIFATIIPDFLPWSNALRDMLSQILPDLAATSNVWVTISFALCLFLMDDFLRYATHYAEHRVPALWELHKVHHSAEVLNFLTAERHHPLASLFFQIVTTLGLVLVNVIFITVFGDQISYSALLGGNVFWVMTNLIGGALRHSPVWLSFGPRIERWLISPAQHQIHHSDNPKHFDCNFGGSLAIWDRMFGTLYITSATREDISYGLGDETVEYRRLSALYLVPLLKIARLFLKGKVVQTQ